MSLTHASLVGVGAVSAYGWGMQALWNGLRSGLPGGRLHTGLGGRYPDPCWFARVPEPGDDIEKVGSSRYAQASFAAVEEAIADSKARGWTPGKRVGIVHATTRADLELMRTRYLLPETVRPRRSYTEQSWTTPSLQVMKKHGFSGPALVTSAACSSGLHALAIGQRLLACGDATDVIVVAADVGFDGEEMTLFASLGPLVYHKPPFEVCRPLQQGSTGFVLGEGVAAAVLTHAKRGTDTRGYVDVLATALGNDHYHPVSIEPSHRHIVETMDNALSAARVMPSDVGYFCAHATGTEECAAADRAALDSLAPNATAFGFKPLLGHCMGAAPLLDTVIIAKSYEERHLPAPIPVASGHPRLAKGPAAHSGGITAQLGLGFGGNIAAAVYGRAA